MTETAEKAPRKKGLLGSSVVVASGTMVSRVLGLVRDVVIGHVFGAGGVLDAFFIAFKIPNFLRRLFAEGAFSQAFIPVLAEYYAKDGKSGVRDLVAHIEAWLGMWLFSITAVMMLAAPWVAIVFAPGFWWQGEVDKLAEAGNMIRITAPYFLFISLTALSGSILNTFKQFAVPALTPVLLNISMIGFTLYGVQYFEVGAHALAWGVFSAGVAQFIFQIPFLHKSGALVRPKWPGGHPGVKKVGLLMIPALFGVSVGQINLLLDTILASALVDGSVSWLYYSDRLAELPLGIIGIALATVVLPTLSSQHVKDSETAFVNTLDWALRLVMLLGVPASVALMVLAEPLLSAIFYHGEMDYFAIEMSALSLRAYALGLLAFMLVKILAPGFYARQNTRTPVRIAIWAMVANMVFNLILVFPLKHAGLALATSMSSWLNAGLLFIALRKEIALVISETTWRVLAQVAVATVAMVAVFWLLGVNGAHWETDLLLARVWQLAVLVVSGLLVYVATLIVLGVRIRHLRH